MEHTKDLQNDIHPREMTTAQYVVEARRQHKMQDLQDEIKLKFRRMTTEQFKDFAFDWFGKHKLSEIIDSEVGKEFDEENLNTWTEMIKARLNI